MLVRDEERSDRTGVHALNASAFETPAEAELVDILRRTVRPFVSLVAEDDSRIVGHILFTPVSLSGHPDTRVAGLGPMAVAPDRQREGIGSTLVRGGLECCRRLGFGAVVVLGHPEYYSRFGFSPSSRFGIECEYEVPKEVFMALELESGYLRGRAGTIRYHSAFGRV